VSGLDFVQSAEGEKVVAIKIKASGV
jgi:hypothetical protein